MSKRPLLLFSGGADSTCRLQELLQTTDVDLLYATGHICPRKQTMELKRRSEIIEYIDRSLRKKKITPFSVVNNYIVTARSNLPINKNHSLQQPQNWLFAALAYYNPHQHSHLEICYVKSDDAVLWHREIRSAWKNLCKVSFGYMDEIEDKMYEIRFPLLLRTKEAIYQELSPTLRKLVWVCEVPRPSGVKGTYQACGHCFPCQVRQEALRNLTKGGSKARLDRRVDQYLREQDQLNEKGK